MVHIDGTARERALTLKKCDGKQKNSAPSPLLLVAIETVSSHAFELLHNGQEVLAAFLDVALLFFQLLLLMEHFLLQRMDGKSLHYCCAAILESMAKSELYLYDANVSLTRELIDGDG